MCRKILEYLVQLKLMGVIAIYGCLLAIGYVSLGLIPIALLEYFRFQEKREAKIYMKIWAISVLSILFALALTLFLDYFG